MEGASAPKAVAAEIISITTI